MTVLFKYEIIVS